MVSIFVMWYWSRLKSQCVHSMISCVLTLAKEPLKWTVIAALVAAFEMIPIKVGLGKVWFNFHTEDLIDLNWFNALWSKHIYMFLEERIIYNGNTRRVSGITSSCVYITHRHSASNVVEKRNNIFTRKLVMTSACKPNLICFIRDKKFSVCVYSLYV